MQSSQFDYKKYLNLLRRRKEILTALALLFMTSAFTMSYLLPRVYESSSTVFIEKNVISELVRGITVIPSLEDTINVLTYAITSRNILNRVIDRMHLADGKKQRERDALIKKLQMNTTVKVKDKNLFTISFTDQNPRLARDFVNTLIAVYIEDSMFSKRGESYDATNFLSDQIKTFGAKLEKAEEQVNAYKREKGGVLSLDEGRLFQEISEARQKLYDLELRRRQLEGMRQITRRVDDPLQSRLGALQKKLEELQVQYTEEYPEVLQVKGEIAAVREQMRKRGRGAQYVVDSAESARIGSEAAALRISEDGLRRYIASNTALLQQIPAAKAKLEKLEMEKQNEKKIYDQLFARQGQSEVSRQMEVEDKSTTFRVVDAAVLPTKPVSPNRVKLMLMGILGGIAGSFGVIFLLEQMDTSVKDVDFVKGLGAPVLAIIPRIEDPVQVSRQRRRSSCFFTVAGIYLLLLLCFPVLELLELPYMDRMIDGMSKPQAVQAPAGKALQR